MIPHIDWHWYWKQIFGYLLFLVIQQSSLKGDALNHVFQMEGLIKR